MPEGERQGVAADLGFSETVFVEDPGQGRLRTFAPKEKLSFAGHPLVGPAWLLANKGLAVPALRPPAGRVPIGVEGYITFVSGRPWWAAPLERTERGSPAEVEARAGPPARPRRGDVGLERRET